MAEHTPAEKTVAEHGAQSTDAVHDGRFGAAFDDEIGLGGLAQLSAWLLGICVVALVIIWLMLRDDLARTDAGPTVAAPIESDLPPAPRLQADPEGEYHQMRVELDHHLEGYGWVDESAGVVHIPIDRAIDWLVEQGVDGRASGAPVATAAEASEEVVEEPVS